MLVFGAGGLRFKTGAGQIGHSVANSSPPLLHFFERRYIACRRDNAEMGSPTQNTLRSNIASKINLRRSTQH